MICLIWRRLPARRNSVEWCSNEGRPGAAAVIHNGVGQSIERHDGIEDTEFGAGTRHSVNGAGSLVLSDGVTATIVDCFHAASTVIAHAGHDDAERCWAKRGGRGKHGDIDGGPVQGVTRFFCELDERLVADAIGQHVP